MVLWENSIIARCVLNYSGVKCDTCNLVLNIKKKKHKYVRVHIYSEMGTAVGKEGGKKCKFFYTNGKMLIIESRWRVSKCSLKPSSYV